MDDTDALGAEAGAPRAKKQKTSGFKWKEKKQVDEDRKEAPTGLHRGYRDRSPRKDSYRERERSPREDGGDGRRDTYDREDRPRNAYDQGDRRRDAYDDRDRRRDIYDRGDRRYDTYDRRDDRRRQDYRSDASYRRDSYRDKDLPRDRNADKDSNREREQNDGSAVSSRRPEEQSAGPRVSNALSDSTADKFGLPSTKGEKKDKPKKPRVVAPSEPMIIVNINDRLGTKAAIPCLASDSVKAFKAIVAAHIGRQPHEIMLKRQGERPFKDQLTLEDYGVSSGVQLDLEIDTGD